jgi:5-methylcytosine-specific restriction endonuclease McrA
MWIMSKAWAGGSDTRWRTFRLTILERDQGECRLVLPGCTREAEQVHHVHALSRGGAKYDPLNCVASCAHCNRKQGDKGPVPQPQPRIVSSW